MKYSLTVFLIFFSLVTKSQHYKGLREVSLGESSRKGYSIIYGKFIQRLGFSSGGFPQDIRLLNTETKEIITFRVKPIFKSARKNNFYFFIPAGHYAILNYWWTKSMVYGGEVHTETIYKKAKVKDSAEPGLKSGETNTEYQQYYRFTITENSLNYMGTWHFDTEQVSFTNDKEKMDRSTGYKYSNIDFSEAIINLPQ